MAVILNEGAVSGIILLHLIKVALIPAKKNFSRSPDCSDLLN